MIFIMIVVTITGTFMAINYLLIYTSGFLYISLHVYIPSLLGYSTGEFQALQLIVLVAFGAMD